MTAHKNTNNIAGTKATVASYYYLNEYNDIMMGKRKTYSSALMAREQGPRLCADVLRLIFADFIHWSHEEVRDRLTMETIKNYKLAPLIKRIPCPPELDRTQDLYFVAWYLYPETRTATEPELIIKLYSDILSGKVKKYPANYFEGNEGYLRAQILLLTMIREYLPTFESVEDLYAYFASPMGRHAIERYKLGIPLRERYGSAVAYLHDSLPWSQKDEELYLKYSTARDTSRFIPVTDEEMDEFLAVTKNDRHVEEPTHVEEEKPNEFTSNVVLQDTFSIDETDMGQLCLLC